MLEILKISNVLRSFKFAANLSFFPVIFGISKHFADVAATLASFRDLRGVVFGSYAVICRFSVVVANRDDSAIKGLQQNAD